MPSYPQKPMGDPPDGTETIVARQGGVLKRFTLSMLTPLFRGAKGDPGAKGDTGIQGSTGVKGDQGATGPQGPSPWVDLGTITVGEKMTLALGASAHVVTVKNVVGLKAGDKVSVHPLAPFPTGGYLLGAAVATADATLDIQMFCPALIIGAAYSFNARVLVARP